MISQTYSIQESQQEKRTRYISNILSKIKAKIGDDHFAYLIISISALLYPLVYVYASMHNFHPLQFNIARGVSNFIYGYIVAHYFGIDLDFRHKKDNKYLMIRTIIMYIQQISYVMMHYIVSISVLNILSISSVIFSFLLDYIINDTKISRTQFWGIIFGFVGIITTVNSQYITSLIDPSYQYTSKFDHFIVHDMTTKIIFSILFLFVTCLWSFALVFQKKIKNYSSMQINHHMNIFFVCVSGVFYPKFVHAPLDLIEFLKGLFISGSLIFITNTLFTTAFSSSKNSGILTLLTSGTIITSYFVSIFIYDENVNWISTAGLIILVYGLVKVVVN